MTVISCRNDGFIFLMINEFYSLFLMGFYKVMETWSAGAFGLVTKSPETVDIAIKIQHPETQKPVFKWFGMASQTGPVTDGVHKESKKGIWDRPYTH